MDRKPIPAFYCCYLLRSTVRRASLYVGSTPHPRRRLAQHNGLSKGGAAKTSRNSLRPWEMTCIVSGFPSHIAALQFEWAWQNTHLTRHIPVAERITEARTRIRTSPKTGRTRRRLTRPPLNLTDKLANLHLLLRADSFCRWPLHVRFFCQDVFDLWQRWCDRVDERISESVKVALDPALPIHTKAGDREVEPNLPAASPRGGIEGLELGYAALRGHLKKSLDLFEARNAVCAVCAKPLDSFLKFAATCPHTGCDAVSHLTCLSASFLVKDTEDVVVPIEGHCPGCKGHLRWVEVVKELSLRVRGDKDLEKILRTPGKRKSRASKNAKDQTVKSGDAIDPIAGLGASDSDSLSEASADAAAPPMEDDWRYIDSDGESASVTSAFSDRSHGFGPAEKTLQARGGPKGCLEIVVEDSEWDDAEILD
ncbi:MAG: Slx4p interacting protein [Caeruleum heppii]|nr:MAG: Slx4p interacting protein [Caeruleum heppii]